MTIVSGWIRELTYGFLLVPGGVALVFVVLAVALVTLDQTVTLELPFTGDAAGARQALSSIAGSLITVAGLSFSITIVTLQLVSSQFSPRAVRGFLADRLNQVIAGIFVGTFAYCLVVLGTIREQSGDQAEFVPGTSVFVAFVLGVSSLGVLLVFIHHMSQSIQVTRIARSIGMTALDAIERLYPDPYGEEHDEPADAVLDSMRAEGEPATVVAERPGFVQLVAVDDMVRAARVARDDARERYGHGNAVVHIRTRPGEFVTSATTIVELWPAQAEADMGKWLRRSIRVVDERDIRQDVGYAIRQLVDIALRAISPGINDPTTALTCLGYVRSIMEQLAMRRFPGTVRRFDDAKLLVVADTQTFDELAVEAFAEVARYGSNDARVITAVLDSIRATAVAARKARATQRTHALVALGEALAAPALGSARNDLDATAIKQSLRRLRDAQRAEQTPTADPAQG